MSTITDSEDPAAIAALDGTESFLERVLAYPRPAAVWTVVALALFALEAGAVAHFVATLLVDLVRALPGTYDPAAFSRLASATAQVPTLLSRETIPNAGYWNGRSFVGTFLQLPPHLAWFLRVGLVYVYSFAFVAWIWVGFDRYRRYYRAADWSPRDDVIDRFRNHYWGIFGLVVVFMFVVMAVFAPALGPTTVEKNMQNPYGHTITHWDAEQNEPTQVTVGQANRASQSRGTRTNNVAPLSYDQFGRYHPFGTLPTGRDLFTFIAAGARISLVIGLLSVSLSIAIASTLALLSAYYKGAVDLSFVLLSDAVMALPQLLLLIMLTVVLSGTWIGNLYNGAFVLALIFAGTGWPYMWRSFRGPALQVAQREWVDAARSFGQRPTAIMRKHMLPYITGYVLIYGSMTLGGAIIAIAGLSYLGLGVNPPTPEWGRAVNAGQPYVDTVSWHISLIPGVLITLVVTGFNALGDGVRDAIDPESDSAAGEAGGRGGGA
ncbi:ABC transporter permease [Halobaculum gomorrense]|uniref:Peptide/nickel transport system permease protein n=1 Tax=Halobaculum gomorrense TaxID=43928 RepID=A0A1M5RIZ3_9EURY|nr:ABC transporter permease [Halobaculum gomorrense]SHH26221.1 peptide/nickel transport system permease protein [Halobaculum gomorrense]